MKMKRAVLLLAGLIWLSSCSHKTTKISPAPTPAPAPAEKEIAIADTAIVQVRSENVREQPNGKIIGKVRRGTPLLILRRVGNWVEFSGAKFDEVFIWAPSLGYKYLNLYSPDFYLNSSKTGFRPVSYFRKIFSEKGQVRDKSASDYELFFKNIGLGRHEETVLDVVNSSRQIVDHGLALYVDNQQQTVKKVRIDFFRPVRGYVRALKKCGLPIVKPQRTSGGHLIWAKGMLLPGLKVDMERKDWGSSLISSVWYEF